MTISTNPEDIDSPETILHYMDSYPASGQNRAAAKLIRELFATAPLIAVSDAAIMKLIDAQYLNGAIRLTWENNSGERVLTDVCKRFTTGILEAAGQVAPQATVEPLRKAAKLAREQLLLWMKDHGQDISSQEAIGAINFALLAISPIGKAVAPEGWKIVPINPTSDMFRAANKLPESFSIGDEYRTMLDAAPVAQAMPVVAEKDALRYQEWRKAVQNGRWPSVASFISSRSNDSEFNDNFDEAIAVLQGEKA